MAYKRMGQWISFEIDISADTKISDECNLGGCFDYMLLEIPTIDTATLTVQAVRAVAGTARNLHITDPADGGDNKLISASGTGAIMWCVPIHGAQYIKLVANAAQTADRVFYVRGVDKYLVLK